MPSDGFTRSPDAIREQLVMACSRRTLATQELNRARASLEQAESALLRAEQEVLMRERHVGLCQKQIDGLLDERLHAEHAVA